MAEKTDIHWDGLKRGKEMFRPDITPEEVIAGYDDWAETFDQAIITDQYRAPAIVMKEVLRLVPPERRPEMRVLDVAAGTGWVGREMHKEGFRHIDAVEPSKGMLKKLKEFGFYRNTFNEPIGTGHSSVPKDTYDLVTVSGGLAAGHIPVCGMDDLVQAAKKGGLVIIAMRLEFLETIPVYKDKLEPYMEELEQKGKWKKVERLVVPNLSLDKEGVVFIFRVT